MALPVLAGVGGSGCGPSNPLQGLTKRFDQDKGLQQDHFGAGRAGSSREMFRSQSVNVPILDQDAARFFSAANAPTPHFAGDLAYDVSALRAALPAAQGKQTSQRQNLSSWASDFIQYQPTQPTQSSAPQFDFIQEAHADLNVQRSVKPAIMQQTAMPWNPTLAFHTSSASSFIPQMHSQLPHTMTIKRISWDREFSAQELNLIPSSSEEGLPQHVSHVQNPRVPDELAHAAGLLLEHVKSEQNPKFQRSQFLGLMKQLRDGEITVEGNKMVESDGARTSPTVHVKGKGRAIEPITFHNARSLGTSPEDQLARGVIQMAEQDNDVQQMEDPNEAYFRQENADFTRYWNDKSGVTYGALETPETMSWGKLQEEWDQFEATTTGIKPITNYQFQDNNPYLLGNSSKTYHHLMHDGERQIVLESVLELEAAVQRDMTNASIWYELGVKQQENEREHKALQALRRAVELDPSLLHAWLALAISYTNDNNRQGTYNAISEWVSRNDNYQMAVELFRGQTIQLDNVTITEKFSHLIQCLISMARSNLSSEIDADIQIALAVLLNTNEEYDKAQDCFRTALAVRPDDWLLHNRVGATMANSGRAEEALQYYYTALELNPGYIRARFNLGISCINLRRYEEAAQHILEALLLQDGDGVKDDTGLNEKRGVVSSALWDSLKTTCLHMQRADLATLCDIKDIDGFHKRFYT